MKSIHHIALLSMQPEELASFYENVLGLEREKLWHDENGQVRSVWLQTKDSMRLMIERLQEPMSSTLQDSNLNASAAEDMATRENSLNEIEIHTQTFGTDSASNAPPGPLNNQPRGWHLLAFDISADERASWREKLTAHGVTITHQTDYTLYFQDPEGNRLALSHYPGSAEIA